MGLNVMVYKPCKENEFNDGDRRFCLRDCPKWVRHELKTRFPDYVVKVKFEVVDKAKLFKGLGLKASDYSFWGIEGFYNPEINRSDTAWYYVNKQDKSDEIWFIESDFPNSEFPYKPIYVDVIYCKEIGKQRKGANAQFSVDNQSDHGWIFTDKVAQKHFEMYFAKSEFQKNILDVFKESENFIYYG